MGGPWSGVRERVLALREAPHWKTVFGAHCPGHGHDFELLPTLDEQELRAVERGLGTHLPKEYRTFLGEVGAGGAGPDYGLFPLRPPAPGAPPATGHAALPFRPERTAELDRLERAEPRRADHPDEAALAAAYAAWTARCDELDDTLTQGTLCVSSQGCGYYSLLVVTGPLRGTMWDDVRAVGEGVLPIRRKDDDRPLPFTDWYLHWLTTAERDAWNPPPRPRLTTDP
ncbi:SMI1/KNR4 family protein [Streptomyces sp. NPDC056600]|uniref:SMI1/KNR4 family protein n=1 Tax=Streptomyces sp. NPDC056600 TaxID=3345874 RepID=UPI0036CA75E8